ncbi:UNKNOWN [Stylonychia lemnae]|uniref:Secreted protein n=1 Tax=Stylonychia lemnae TaxID=5949 RepID=A0A078AFS8_STYLE|nr:UNKNOWN [Stylonychia lemnae]|eukprot:CDW81115.1 UNKNOWN [Stylonychia lemnae]
MFNFKLIVIGTVLSTTFLTQAIHINSQQSISQSYDAEAPIPNFSNAQVDFQSNKKDVEHNSIDKQDQTSKNGSQNEKEEIKIDELQESEMPHEENKFEPLNLDQLPLEKKGSSGYEGTSNLADDSNQYEETVKNYDDDKKTPTPLIMVQTDEDYYFQNQIEEPPLLEVPPSW